MCGFWPKLSGNIADRKPERRISHGCFNVTDLFQRENGLSRVLVGSPGCGYGWANGGYIGENFAQWAKGLRLKPAIEVVKRSAPTKISKYWRRRDVDRIFGWLLPSDGRS